MVGKALPAGLDLMDLMASKPIARWDWRRRVRVVYSYTSLALRCVAFLWFIYVEVGRL